MFKRLLPLFGIGLFAGCGSGANPPGQGKPQSERMPRFEVHVGDSERARLPFKIVNVYEKRSPSSEAPYHVEGGEWTYFDCQTPDDPPAVFTVGVRTKPRASDLPARWGEAFLIVADRQAGEKFIKSFGARFAGTVPPAAERSFSPSPLPINTSFFGENLNRETPGGFSGQGGGWTATKWFPTADERDAEVYFNYNAEAREGEFSEKDADYADDLLAIWASALRDGPKREPVEGPSR